MRNKNVIETETIKLDNQNLLFEEALFHNANGYIGIRSAFEEGYPEEYTSVRGQYINGFYDFTHKRQAEGLGCLVNEKQTMLNIADTQSIKIHFDDETFSMFEGKVLKSKRWVDLAKGVTGRNVLWHSPKGKELELTIIRMTAFHQPSLFTIEYKIKSINFSGEIIVESGHYGNVLNFFNPDDPRTAEEAHKHITPVSCNIHLGSSFITSKTSSSELEVCSCVNNFLSGESDRQFSVDACSTVCQMVTSAEIGQEIRLVKYATFADSRRALNCKCFVEREMKKALSIPLEKHYQLQEDYLTDYWENCYIEIDGDDELNMALNYNLFQLVQSVSKDTVGNIAPKGLSGEGYEGQYFWDTEMYIQPFFTLTNSHISKNLILFRYRTLEMAKENARRLGHKSGALYPWRTIMGRECSGYFPAGAAQYHINGDIAYSIIAYFLATNDIDFIAKKGAEIIMETARLWLDVGNFIEGKFQINSVTGPDEYTCIVNNNYYTNVLAQYHLNWAVKFYNELKSHPVFKKMIKRIRLSSVEIDLFKKAASYMHLLYDEKLKINPQDDSFLQKEILDIDSIPKNHFPLLLNYHPLHLYRYQICKQPDTVLAHFIIEDAQSHETMQNSFEYYEKITTHDSSLSKCIFSIMAARLGKEQKAYEYFGNAAKLDLFDLQHNTKDGVHTGNMGGNYMAIVYGFGGLRLKADGVFFSPMLPQKWTGYKFRILYRGTRFMVSISKGKFSFHLEDGEPQKLHVYGKEYVLTKTLTVSMEKK